MTNIIPLDKLISILGSSEQDDNSKSIIHWLGELKDVVDSSIQSPTYKKDILEIRLKYEGADKVFGGTSSMCGAQARYAYVKNNKGIQR